MTKSEAIQELVNLCEEENREKYPNLPDHARVKPSFKTETANGLTKAIIRFLELKGHQAERINMMGRVIRKARQYKDVLGNVRQIGKDIYIPSTGKKGTADISATIYGKSVKIEVKIGKDRQSEHQKEYQRQQEKAGGVYFIAKTFEEFFDWYYREF